jgi:hypothetical protein
MTPPTHTTAPIGVVSVSTSPEFVDSKGLRAIYGISRSMGYALADAGLVKTVCLRRPGAVKGRRLWVAQSLREFLLANLDERKCEREAEVHKEPAAPKAQAPQRDPALEALYAQNRELRARLAKITS